MKMSNHCNNDTLFCENRENSTRQRHQLTGSVIGERRNMASGEMTSLLRDVGEIGSLGLKALPIARHSRNLESGSFKSNDFDAVDLKLHHSDVTNDVLSTSSRPKIVYGENLRENQSSPGIVAMMSDSDSKESGSGCDKYVAWRRRFVHFITGIARSIVSYLEGNNRDADGGEVERHTLRYIPDSIERLLSITRFTKRELKSLYRNFKNECPTGVVNEETFKEIYCQFFPNGDADTYAHYVFRSFDHHDEGYINFEEFAVGLSSLLRGTLADRLHWTFRLYDINHDGYITREEMLDIIKSVYMLLGKYVEPALTDEDYIQHTERIFTKLDKNGDGLITIDEFCESCSDDETIVQSMSVFDNAL